MCNQGCDYKKCFKFDMIENIKDVEAPRFTKKNIALINAFLTYDSNYSAAKSGEEGSYSYILEHQKEEFWACLGNQPEIGSNLDKMQKKDRDKYYDALDYKKDILYLVIEDIDRINSTHLASEGAKTNDNDGKKNKGRANTACGIRNITNLKERLEKGDSTLVKEIASFGSENKYNFSFATKFCAYVCRHALGVDNYCIYDEVVQSILPFYIDKYVSAEKMPNRYYKIVNKKDKNKAYVKSTVCELRNKEYKGNGYEEYRKIIDEIKTGIEDKDKIAISYEEFDHILWYYFKGSKTKVKKTLNSMMND